MVDASARSLVVVFAALVSCTEPYPRLLEIARSDPKRPLAKDQIDLLATHATAPEARAILFAQLAALVDACPDTDPRIEAALTALTTTAPAVDYEVEDVAKVVARYPSESVARLAAALPKTPMTTVRFARSLAELPAACAHSSPTRRNQQVQQALAVLDRMGEAESVPSLAGLLALVYLDATPPPLALAKLEQVSDNATLAEAHLRLLADVGSWSKAEFQRFAQGAAPHLRKLPPPVINERLASRVRMLRPFVGPNPLSDLVEESATKKVKKDKIDPQDIESLLANAPSLGPPSLQMAPTLRRKGALHAAGRQLPPYPNAADTIIGMGDKTIPLMIATFDAGNPGRARVAAEVLGKLRPRVLADKVLALLSKYEASASDEQKVELGLLIGVGDYGLRRSQDAVADTPLFRALGSTDEDLTTFGLTGLRHRFASRPDALVDAIFTYLSPRQEFKEDHLEAMLMLIRESGPSAGASVERNLEKLLADARGRPASIFWAKKYVGLAACWSVCGAAAVPVLEKYQSDTSGYESVRVTMGPFGAEKKTETEARTFAALANRAIDAAKQR